MPRTANAVRQYTNRRPAPTPPPAPVAPEESKRDRFYRIMEPRVARTIKDIGLLSYGADRTRYDPTEDDIANMAQTLHDAVDKAMGAYQSKVRGAAEFRFARLPEDGC